MGLMFVFGVCLLCISLLLIDLVGRGFVLMVLGLFGRVWCGVFAELC